MISDVETLNEYARAGTIIRHFLEPTIKAPKLFHLDIPEGVENPECEFSNLDPIHDTFSSY